MAVNEDHVVREVIVEVDDCAINFRLEGESETRWKSQKLL